MRQRPLKEEALCCKQQVRGVTHCGVRAHVHSAFIRCGVRAQCFIHCGVRAQCFDTLWCACSACTQCGVRAQCF